MQIKPLNQNYSHEQLGNKALLVQGPYSTSVTSCLSGKSQVARREATVCIMCIISILSFLYSPSIMLKKPSRGLNMLERQHILHLYTVDSTAEWEKSLPINWLGLLCPDQTHPLQSLAVQWDRYNNQRHQGLRLGWWLLPLLFYEIGELSHSIAGVREVEHQIIPGNGI